MTAPSPARTTAAVGPRRGSTSLVPRVGRDLLRALARPGPVLVLALGTVYGVSVRQETGRLVAAQGGDLDGWAVLLSVLADPYATFGLFLPVAAVWACGHVVRRFDHAALVRHGSWARWLSATVRGGLAPVAALVLVWCAAGLLATTGLPWHGGLRPTWQSTAGRDLLTAELLPYLAGSGLPPPALLAAQLLLLAVVALGGLTLLGAAVVAARDTGHAPLVVALVAVGGVLLPHLAFRVPGLPGWADPTRFLLLAPALDLPAGPWTAVAAWVAVMVLTWLAVHRYGAAHRARRAASTRRIPLGLLPLPPRPVGVYAALCVAGMVAVRGWGDAWLPAPAGPWDTIALTLYGSSPDGAAGVLWLYHSVVVVGFGYLLVLHLHAALGPHAAYAMLRHGSPRRWARRTVAPALLAAPAVLAGLVALALVLQQVWPATTPLPAGAPPLESGTASALVPRAGTGALLFQLLVNGWVQLTVVVLAVLLTALAARGRDRPLWPTGVLALILVAAAPGPADAGLLPAALGGAGQATGGWPSVLAHSAVLTIWAAVLTAGVLVLLSRLGPQQAKPGSTSRAAPTPAHTPAPATARPHPRGES